MASAAVCHIRAPHPEWPLRTLSDMEDRKQAVDQPVVHASPGSAHDLGVVEVTPS